MNIDTDHSTPGSTPMTQAEEGNNPNSCASRQDNDVNSKGVNGVTKMMPSMEDIFNSDEDEEEADFEPERDFTEITDRIRKESDKKRRRLTGYS